MDFDTTDLNKPLSIDQPVTVPLTIKYYNDFPSEFEFLFGLPGIGMLFKKQVFGSAMAPLQQIKLSIVDPPEWANIHLVKPTVLAQVPFPSDPDTIIETDLVIIPYREAPAESTSITVVAECDDVGKLSSFSDEFTITFSPVYIPRINVVVEQPVRQVSPRETVNFKVTITNNANKRTIVRFDYNAPSEWAPVITREVDLAPMAKEVVYFSVKAPYDFGWHDKTISMTVKCQPYPDPLPDNLSQFESAAISADIQITNYGFSFSGAEPILVILLIIVIILGVLYYLSLIHI